MFKTLHASFIVIAYQIEKITHDIKINMHITPQNYFYNKIKRE